MRRVTTPALTTARVCFNLIHNQNLNMRKSKQALHALALETETPPPILPDGQFIARVTRVAGHSVYEVEYAESAILEQYKTAALHASNLHPPSSTSKRPSLQLSTPSHLGEAVGHARHALVELASRFRGTVWLRAGGYVLVDRRVLAGRENKLDGEIVNVVRDEKAWRKREYWPEEFAKVERHNEDDASEDEDEEDFELEKAGEDDDDDGKDVDQEVNKDKDEDGGDRHGIKD